MSDAETTRGRLRRQWRAGCPRKDARKPASPLQLAALAAGCHGAGSLRRIA